MDSDFRFSYLSPYTESLFGYTLKEWETLDWNVFISPDYKEFVFNYLNNLKLKNEVVLPIIPVSVRHKNGNEMWVEFSANGIFNKDNVFTGIAGITRDVTERKLAEKKLEKKNAYIKMILDNFPIGIATNEIDSMKVTYMNRKFSEFYGWAEDDFPDVGIFFEKVFPELEYRQQMQTRILADLASGDIERMNWDDLKITTKTGDQRIVHAFNIPLLDQNIMVSTVQDITERKQAEEKNKSLLAEKELILKEVNHRIKNNMNTMKGLLLLQATTMNEAAAKTALENASKRMQSMEILYDQLYQSAAFTELSIKSYLSPLIDAFIVSFPEGNLVKVEKHIDDFILDAKRLQPLGIIINELLTNIMKYAFTNKSKGIITVTVILEDAHVILSVQDNGKGIPASINFTNSTGFGLMLVHVLTGQLDGKIQIERVGGTRIVLDFEK
jgi:PAS domain S-box-containing protein